VYWREASNGLAALPYFLGSSFVDVYYILLAPLIFVGTYWHLTLPAANILVYYLAFLAAVWWSSGVAYAISGLMPSSSTLIATVFLCMIVGAFLSGTQPTIAQARGGALDYLLRISYSRCAWPPCARAAWCPRRAVRGTCFALRLVPSRRCATATCLRSAFGAACPCSVLGGTAAPRTWPACV
jgi:hypothetical protein